MAISQISTCYYHLTVAHCLVFFLCFYIHGRRALLSLNRVVKPFFLPNRKSSMPSGEIFVVTGSGQGHVHPCMELCKHLISRNYHATLVVPSHLSSTIPSSFSSHHLVSIAQISVPSGPPMPRADQQGHDDLLAHLSARSSNPDSPRVLCAIVDFQLGWSKECFWKFQIPVISFFTFGACAAAMEWGAWKAQAGDLGPGESRPIPGLPDEMAVTYWDLKRKPMGPPPGVGGGGRGGGGRGGSGRGGGPPGPGDRPPWVSAVEGCAALMFNTCDDLERPFLEYMEAQVGIPAYGVGPLLPEQYWKSSDSLVSDREIRQSSRQSSHTEDDVITWLDSKPHKSVLYVAFGSEVGPSIDEYPSLAGALEESSQSFIWAVQSKPGQSGYFPHGLDAKVGGRGLVINGWAPQLLILSHPSTGGFLSHCGWNSTAEAVGRGVPVLAWPIRGDQHYNSKLVVSHLRVGYRVADNLSENVKKDDIVKGIERLMGDGEVNRRAAEIKARFGSGFPASSKAALDAFGDDIISKKKD